jgi:hypothetical protein
MVVLLVATAAQAGTVNSKYTGKTGTGVNVQYTGDLSNVNKTADGGLFNFTVLAVSSPAPLDLDPNNTAKDDYVAFCIELVEYITLNQVATYNVVPAALAPVANSPYGAMTAQGQADLELLFGSAAWQTVSWTPDQATAFQLAVWEIVYENAIGSNTGGDGTNEWDGTYDITNASNNGNFKSSVTGGILALVNTYLGYVNSPGANPTYGYIAGLSNTSVQDYVTKYGEGSTPGDFVPLPPAVLMGFGLLGALGLARGIRRRK